MPLGELFSCAWLVLLALNLMTTFPSGFRCNSYSTTTHSSSSSASSSSTSELLSSQPEQHSATAAISANLLCRHSFYTSELISADCQQIQQKQQEPRMRITGEISEGPGPPSCPAACPRKARSESARSEKTSLCYRYLVHKDCEDSSQNDDWDWSPIRLRHCCEHSVGDTVLDAKAYLKDRPLCERHVNELLELDAFVAKVTCQFEQVLQRYDCHQNYSVNDCEKCRAAYRRWVCASLIPHWRERHKIKPCRSICHAVEQNCPWFLPAEKVPGYPAQYAGEPIFQCIDSNIPETGEQLLRSTYGSGCCYEYCEQLLNNEVILGPTYHHSEMSRLSQRQTVSCVKGCNDSTSDPSESSKTGSSAPCKNNPSSSTTSTTASSKEKSASQTNRDGATIPFVNFPLSSCPSFETSGSSPNSDSALNMKHSGTNTKALSNLLIFWFVFYMFFTNSKFIGLS